MKNTLKNLTIKNRLRILLIIPILAFILGVCFVSIPDKTKIKRRQPIEYIVVHYTANLNPRADARMNAYYLRNKHRAGTHYCIDDKEVIQCTPENMIAYAVGDRKWFGFIPKPWFINQNGSRKIRNANSLSFEMCLGGGRDDDKIIETTAQMIGWQLVNKGLDISRVVRHHDVSGKQCPKFNYNESWNQSKEDSSFAEFKKKVQYYQNIHLERKRQLRVEQAKIVQ